jgi:hypothetical protein
MNQPQILHYISACFVSYSQYQVHNPKHNHSHFGFDDILIKPATSMFESVSPQYKVHIVCCLA